MQHAGLSDDLSLDGRTVLLVVPSLDEGRRARLTIATVVAISDAGGRALVVAEKGELLGEAQAAGGEWIPLPVETANPVRMIANVISLSAHIDREAVDIVHVRGERPAWTAWAATRLSRRRLVVSLENEPVTWLGRAQLRGDAVLVPSTELALRLQSHHNLRNAALRVVSPGLSLGAFDRDKVTDAAMSAFRLAAGAQPGYRLVVQWGPFTPDQGQIVLIDAVRLLVNGGLSGVVFAIVPDGEGPDRAELEARIAAQGVGALVRIVDAPGPVALAAADLSVVSPLEPQSIALQALQSIAAGAVTIGSRIGAVPDVLRTMPEAPADRTTGLLVAPGDAVPLAEGLSAALSLGAEERAGLSARARRHAGRFTVPRMQDDVLRAYGSLLVTSGH